jgi:pSer/pThr/pTyr-binding forkhead associated (FHA) protein
MDGPHDRFDSFLLIHAEDDATDPAASALRTLATIARGARLRQLDGAVFAVRDGLTCIGRSSQRVVRVPDANVSRKHAEIVRRGERYIVRDMNTPNGTYVNGQRIRGEVALTEGDQLRVGHTTLVFERSAP